MSPTDKSSGFFDKLADQLGELIVPDDLRAHTELGQAYLDAGNLQGAERELEAALVIRADHSRAQYLLGVVREKMGDPDGATKLYEQASLREGFVEPFLALGQLAMSRGDHEKAISHFRRALDGGTGDVGIRAEAYRGLGAANLALGRYDRAVRELRKAVASAPDEITAQTLLGRALLHKGDLDTARICLERATRREPVPPLAWSARGEVALALGRGEEAQTSFRAALAGIAALPEAKQPLDATGRDLRDAEVLSRLGLAKLARLEGRLDEARGEILQALGHAPSHLGLLVELGRIAALAQSPEVALDAFDRALAGGGQVAAPEDGQAIALLDPRPLLAEALSVALGADLRERAAVYAEALLLRDATHPEAHAALALRMLLREGDVAAFDAEAQLLLADPSLALRSVEVKLAEAEVALRRGTRDGALVALRRAAQLSPSDPRPRTRYAALFRREDPAPGDVAGLLAAAHRLSTSAPELAELQPALGRLRESLDRPLVITVMGEFNAGKSTFVNAFLGEEVAPMGVTPTTATVNLLKYGPERGGRIIHHDESTREIAWADVPAFLKNLTAEQAKRIRLVELLFPLEVLQRINVVDTPGLNSIHPEHEATARRFIEEADAVIWLFSVDQAAKASEGEALGKIASHGRKILGVLNKIDRADEGERAQIIAHVQRSVGDRLETVVPVSARAALAARRSGDATALAASNYPTLDATLEERFFNRARVIQRRVAMTRAASLLEQARQIVDQKLSTLSTDADDRAAAAVRADSYAMTHEFLPAERRRLLEASDEALKVCTREVLDFVRPRRSLFGGNEATPADRDFLLALLEERLTTALATSRLRLLDELRRSVSVLAQLVGPGERAAVLDRLELLDDRVFGRYRAFVRGYLRGGAVATFFSRDLPKLDLVETEVRRALERASPLDDDTLEEELRQPLRAYCQALFSDLLSAIAQHREDVALGRFDLECRLVGPIESLRQVIAAGLQEPPTP